jgi:hypothetical protein
MKTLPCGLSRIFLPGSGALSLALAALTLTTLQPAGAAAQDRHGFPDVPTDPLSVYGSMTRQTVLLHPAIPRLAPLTNSAEGDTNAALAAIKSVVAKNGIELLPLGEKFTLAVPTDWSNSPEAAAIARIKLRKSSETELIPAGMIDFRGLQLEQLIPIYGDLRNRTILRSAMLSSPAFVFRTQSPLTKDEASYALEVLLALHGIATVDDGDKFVQISQAARSGKVQLQAPVSKEGAELINPKDVPRLEFAGPRRQVTGSVPPPRPTADRLGAFYAQLTDQAFVPSGRTDTVQILFQVRNSLTKAELLYAIETTLALNDMAIIPVGGQAIRLGRPKELGQVPTTTK